MEVPMPNLGSPRQAFLAARGRKVRNRLKRPLSLLDSLAGFRASEFCHGLSGILGFCLFAGMSLPLVEAQTTSATVSGAVTDPTGAAVPGAVIQVKNINTSLTQS